MMNRISTKIMPVDTLFLLNGTTHYLVSRGEDGGTSKPKSRRGLKYISVDEQALHLMKDESFVEHYPRKRQSGKEA